MFIDWFLFAAQWAQAALKIHIVHTFLFFDWIKNSEKAFVMERIKNITKMKIIFNPVELKLGVDTFIIGEILFKKEIQLILVLYNLFYF